MVAAAVLAIVTVAVTIRRGLRRRRLHRLLIKESVIQLCAYRAEEPTGVRRTHRDLVRLIISLVAQARVLNDPVRPQVPERPGKRNPISGVLVGEAVAEDLHRALLALTRTEPTLPALDIPDVPDIRARGPLHSVPHLDEIAPLDAVLTTMRTTLRSQVRQVQIVVRHAELLGLIEQECRDRLRAGLSEVVAADRQSEKLSAAGDAVAATKVLTEIVVPVPQDSLPGEGARRDLDEQAVVLTEIATAYREVLVDWCLEALERCGPAVPASRTGQVAT